jgi:hypothetical protein
LNTWLVALVAAIALAPRPLLAAAPAPAAGVVWQLHENAPDAEGAWHKLGARELLLQWTAVDGVAFVRGTGMRESARMPNWRRIAREPWARRVILGLSGRTSEQLTRVSLDAMVEESLRIASIGFPFEISGYYFPAEVDPTWRNAPALLPPALSRLPRPLWVSVYDRSKLGPQRFTDWLAAWLPSDVGVLFQDGVGIHVRSAAVARQYADTLAERLGQPRVRIIAEAFREESGNLRPARAAELREQLASYQGFLVYLFDGPHYVSERLVDDVLAPNAVAPRP